MGEAKIRKATDPSYGKVPKERQSRGLIISTPIQIDTADYSFSAEGGLDPSELRFSLLYWDKLVHPQSNFFRFDGGDDAKFLVSAGVLSQPTYMYRSGDPISILINTYLAAFFDKENKEPGTWSLLQGEKSLLVNNLAVNHIEESGISLELIRAIPVPAADVPLNEILEFKEKRKDELKIFRVHIDALVFEIQNSPARTEAFNRIAKEVDGACADLLKVGHEWQWPVHFSDFTATFNFNASTFSEAVEKGWELGKPLDVYAQTAVAAIAGFASTININSDISLRSIKKPRGPFSYAFLAHKELV